MKVLNWYRNILWRLLLRYQHVKKNLCKCNNWANNVISYYCLLQSYYQISELPLNIYTSKLCCSSLGNCVALMREVCFFFYCFFCSCDTNSRAANREWLPASPVVAPFSFLAAKCVWFNSKALLERCSDFFSSLKKPWGWTLWFNKPVRFLPAS